MQDNDQVIEAEIEAPQEGMQKATALELDERGIYKITTQKDEYRVAQMLLRTGAVPATFKNPEQVMMAIQALKSLGLNWRTALRQCGFNHQGAFIVYGDLELAVVRQSGFLEAKEEFLYTLNPAWTEGGDNTRVLKDKDGNEVLVNIPKHLRRCFENGNSDLPVVGACCRMKRKGDDTIEESTFTVEDAKVSGLWGKTPTWKAYPGRMMQMRARGVAIRNMFSDVTQGLGGHEYDVEGIEYDKK